MEGAIWQILWELAKKVPEGMRKLCYTESLSSLFGADLASPQVLLYVCPPFHGKHKYKLKVYICQGNLN